MSLNIIKSILGIALLGVLFSNLMQRQMSAFTTSVFHAKLIETSVQQASFARAVSKFISAGGVAAGTVITPAQMITDGDLAPGYPAANPLGQTPEAIVGSNSTALITYTGTPSAIALEQYGITPNSTLVLESIALEVASDITAMQAGLPQFSGGMLYNGSLTTPMNGVSLNASTDFSGMLLPAGPIFVDMLNVAPVPTYNSNAGYGAATGD